VSHPIVKSEATRYWSGVPQGQSDIKDALVSQGEFRY